jgi:hypothetical protein
MPFKETSNFLFFNYFTALSVMRKLGLILFLIFGWGLSQGFGQITLRGSSTYGETGDNLAIPRPADLQVGDVMIATIAQNDNNGVSLANSFSTGWILIDGSEIWRSGNNNNSVYASVLYRVASLADVSAASFTFSNTNADNVLGGISAFSGVDANGGVGGTPFDVAPGTLNLTGGGAGTANSITSVTNNSAVVMVSLIANNITMDTWAATSPASLREVYDTQRVQNDNRNMAVGAAYELKPVLGATGNGSVNYAGGNARNASLLLALRPCSPQTGTLSGAQAICVGGTTTFISTVSGGTWSTNSAAIATINSSTGVITGVSAGTATITYTVTGTSGCANGITTRTVTVNTAPSGLSYTFNNPTYCAGQAITTNSASTGGGSVATSFSVSPELPAGLALNTTTGQITGTPSTVAGLEAANYTLTASNSCGNATRMLNIRISPAAPTGLNYTSNSIAYCSSQPINANSASTSGGGAATSFSVSPALPPGLVLNTTTGQITGTPSTIAGIAAANYTVTASNSCGNTFRLVNITISPPAAVGAVTPNQLICNGSSPANISIESATGTIQWQWANDAAFTSGVTDLGTNSLTLISAQIGPITATRYYRARVTRGSCVVFSDVITATVPPNNTAISAAPNQTVCINASLAPITFTTTGSTNIGAPINLPAGLSASWIANTLTISGTPIVTGTFNYSIPLTGGCGTVAATGTIIVNPSSIINNMTAEVCSTSGFSVTPANGTNGVVLAGTTYSWSAPVVTGGITGGAAGSGSSITGTLVNPTNIPRKATYTVSPTFGGCVGDTFLVTVTINPRPTIPNQIAEICSGSAFTVSPINSSPTAATIVPAGTTYTWIVIDNPNVTGESTQGTAQATISQALNNTSNVTQTVTYTVTPISGATGACKGAPFTVAVTVNPSPVIPAQTASICSGAAFVITPINGPETIVPAGTTYTWSVVENPNVIGEANQAGPQGNISQTLTNTTTSAQIVTYTVTPTSGTTGSCVGASFTISVSVDPRPAITTMSTPVCSEDTFTVTPVTGTNGIVPASTSYAWSVPSVTGGITGGAVGSGNNITGTLFNSTNTVQTATYTVIPTSGLCAGNSFTVAVTVSPRPAMTSIAQTVCSDDSFLVTPIDGTNGVVPIGTTYAWIAPVVTGEITGGVAGSGTNITGSLINLTNTIQTATYTVTPTSGLCVGTPYTITISVSPRPATLPITQTLCSGDSFTVTPENGTNGVIPAGTTYAWSLPTMTGGVTGGVAGSGTSITGTLTNPTNTTQTATYTVTPTSGLCAGNAFSVTVTISPRPAVTLITQTRCSGDSFTITPANGTNGIVPAGTTYSWSTPILTGGLTGGVAGNGTSIIGTFTNPTNSPQTATYTVTPSSGLCVGSTFNVTVTVSPRPAVTSITETLCSTDSFSVTPANGTNGVVPAGTTYTWSIPVVTGSMSGGAAGSGTTITGTLTNPTNTTQTAIYTVTPTTGSCVGNQFTISVTVSPRPTISNMTETVCNGDSFSLTPVNGTNGVVPAETTYTWSIPSMTGGVTGGVAGSGTSITGALTNPTNTTQTATYAVTPTSGSCAGSAFTVIVTLSPRPTIANLTDTLCSSDTFTVTPISGTDGIIPVGTTFAWLAPSVTGGITGGAAGSGTNVTGTLTNPTNTSQTATYTIAPTSGSCSGSSFTVTVIVNPRLAVTPITETLCSGDSFTAAPINGTNGVVPAGTTYTWSAPLMSGGLTGGSAGDGASISGTLTNPTASPQTATYIVTSTSGSCGEPSFTVTVTVNPITFITTQPNPANYGICFGDGFADISISATGSSLTYQWYRNTTNSNSGGTLILGATSASFSVPSTPEGIAYYYAVVTGTCGAITSDVSGRYTVFPPATEFTTNLTNSPQTICPGDSFTEITALATGANLTYQWYSNTSSSNAEGTLIPGETTGSFTPPNTVFGPTYYYVVASSDCGTVPSAVSGAFAITGTTSVTSNPTVCVNTSLNPFITHATTGSTGIGTATGLPPGVTATWSNNVITISGTPTTIVGSPFNYSIPLIGACNTQFATGMITVNPRAELTNMTTMVCSGNGFTLTPVNGTNGVIPAGTTYSWSAPVVTGGITGGATGSGNSISGTLTNPTNIAQTATYTVTPLAGSCPGPIFSVTVTVNPSPVIPNQTASACSESAFTVSPTNGSGTIVPTGTSYTWTVVDNPNVTGDIAQGTPQANISQTLTNTTNIAQIVTYTVTPTSGATGSCVGNPFTVTVTVNPRPAIPAQTTATCSGSAFTVSPANDLTTAATIVPAGTTYTWTVIDNPNVIGDAAESSPQANISQTLTNNTATAQTVTYTVTPISGSCAGDTFPVTVTVNPTPRLSSPSTASRCSSIPTTYTATSATSGTTFSWTRALVAGISNPAGSGSGAAATETLVNTTANPIDITYVYTLSANGCSNSQNVTVTVNPTPTLSSSSTPPAICSNSAFTYTPTSATSGVGFSWTRAFVRGISNPAVTLAQTSNPNETLINTTANPVNVVYTYTITANGCSNTQNVTVTVNPTPNISSPTTASRCSNVSTTYTATSATSGASFSWTRAAVAGISNAASSGSGAAATETLVNTTALPIDVTYGYTLSANGCSSYQNVTVTVNPTPTLTSPAIAIRCTGISASYTATSGTPGTNFSWTRAAVPGISNTAGSGSGATATETLFSTTANPVDVTYAYTLTANGCSTTQNVTVTINPTPILSSSSTPPAICSNSVFIYTPTSVTTGATFTWIRAAVAGISNPGLTTPQTSNPSETLINTTTGFINVVYAFTITSDGCSNTQNVTVRVNPTPTLSSTLTPPAVCSNVSGSYTATSAIIGTTLSWTRAIVSGISNSAGSGSTATATETLMNTTAYPINVTYRYTLTADGCANTQNVTITVNPRPSSTPDPITTAVCNGQFFSVVPITGANGIVPSGTTYTWTTPTVTGGSLTGGTSGSGSSISGTLSYTDNTARTATYTVTPSSGGCTGPAFEIVVTVNPIPTVNAVNSPPAICNGLNSSVIPFLGSSVSGTVYNWTNSNPSIGLSASGLGTIPSFTAINTSASQVTATITVTPVANGCSGIPRTFTITVNPSPVITIVPDFCVVGGKVQLIASSNIPGTTWSWDIFPVQTTSSILVDLAGNYSVTGTANGCSTSASIGVAEELVANGSFTAGNTGFKTGYIYEPNVGGNNELIPEGKYSVGVDGQNYHPNFWGIDHTNNTVGQRNMMIVNGFPESSKVTIWEQTVTVEPNTEYYFSAWAMSINAVSPYARLRFEVNGIQVGTTANLGAGPANTTQAAANNYWVPFRSDPLWNSGNISGPITIKIVNLEPAAGGNDFALDDISFGTLSTFIRLTSAVGTDNQTVCQDSPIADITYTAGSGAAGPAVSGLPPGVTTSWNGITLRFTGTPTASGIFNYTITTPGFCLPSSATGTITVLSAPTPGIIANDQTICVGGDPVAFISTVAGTGAGILTYLWEFNSDLTTPNWTTITGQTEATHDVPAGLAKTTQYRRTTIATSGTVICQSAPTESVQVTIQPVPTAGAIASAQTICRGGDPAAFISTSAGTGSGAITYRWESAVGPFTSWSSINSANSATYNPPAGLIASTQYRRITISTINGVPCESAPTVPIQVTVQSTPTAGAIAISQMICSGGDPYPFLSTTAGTGDGTITYRWESNTNLSSPSWSIVLGQSGATYDVPAGLTATTGYRRITISTLNSVSCESSPTPTVQVTILPNNTVNPATPQTICINNPIASITHTTTGAVGIANDGVAGANGLPNGVTASWNAGVITISGTPTEEGTFNYSIPLAGGCGTVNATGTITISNPSYPISNISVVNPLFGTPPYTSTFTVNSTGFTLGNYVLEYSTAGINQGPNQTITATVTTAGELTFSTLPYSTEGTTVLTLISIQRDTDFCPYFPPNNTTPYGVNCSSEFTGNDIFYVPAGVSQVTIQAFGADPTDSQTMAVLPSGAIFIVFDGTAVFATEAPASLPMADRLAQAIVRNVSPNGRIVVNYNCTPLPCSGSTDVFQYNDTEGFTIIRFTGACDWVAPDGLDEFEVLVVGGGGGGGFGDAAGGGGGGAVIYQKYTEIAMNGFLGLQGAGFLVTPGGRGLGATTSTQSQNGFQSSFTGPLFSHTGGTFATLDALGGGGGGSTKNNPAFRQGANGASGGGGAALGPLQSAGGAGSAGNNGGSGNAESFGISGAGGGGAASVGVHGTSTGGAEMVGGPGGNGIVRDISGENVYYGAGGGATSSGAIVNLSGLGGSLYSATNGNPLYAGGSGNNNGIGQLASTYGSGGGAGRLGGSAGFPGVVYIRYPNSRILPVEFLYFNVTYNSVVRSGDLTWATAKEWENDRFQIERSVNNVKEWEAISEIAGAGCSDAEVKYDYSDLKLPVAGGNIFYRLKQYDFNGEFTYSDTKAIKVEALPGTTRWRVFPNPTTGNPLTIEILDPSAYREEAITLRIIATTGQFDSIKVTEMKNMGTQVSDLFEFKAAGIYTIEISWGANREYHKVILNR